MRGGQTEGTSERFVELHPSLVDRRPRKGLVELLRCLVLATVVPILINQADLDTWSDGLALEAALWIGFPLVLWTGAIIHESTPGSLPPSTPVTG